MTIRVARYTDANQAHWDAFVAGSKNGTFLFFRNYMDYHRDRFVDHSLLIWNDKGRLIALLPASKQGDMLISHGGLTYGGFVTNERMNASLMLEVFEHTLVNLRQQ